MALGRLASPSALFANKPKNKDSMKKASFLPLALFIILLASCSGSDEEKAKAKAFAMNVVKTIGTDNKTQLASLYPGASNIDSLAVPDTATVTVVKDNDSVFTVSFGAAATMILSLNSQGHFTVTSSKGLLGIPADYTDFAYKTGWLDSTLTDAGNAVRMKDVEFANTMKRQMDAYIDNLVTITGQKRLPYDGSESCTVTLTVSNNSDEEIFGRDYQVEAKIVTQGMMELFGEWNDMRAVETEETFQGKSIKPHEKVTFPYSAETDYEPGHASISGTIVWKLSTERRKKLTSGYKFTGKEYAEYVKDHH